MFGISLGGIYKMTNLDEELLQIINDDDEPEQALKIAFDIIISYLRQS